MLSFYLYSGTIATQSQLHQITKIKNNRACRRLFFISLAEQITDFELCERLIICKLSTFNDKH